MRDLVIVGSSGFAREIAWNIDRINQVEQKWNFLGYIDNNEEAKHVVGNDDFLVEYDKELDVVIAIGNPTVRSKLFKFYKQNKWLNFPNIIDPSVLMSDTVVMGKGNIICANTILTVDIKMGDFNIINLDCTVGHGSTVEDYVTINPSVNISGDVYVNALVNIGTGTQIIQGKSIGCKTQIGAGAVVVTDLPCNCTAVGIPARPIKFDGGKDE